MAQHLGLGELVPAGSSQPGGQALVASALAGGDSLARAWAAGAGPGDLTGALKNRTGDLHHKTVPIPISPNLENPVSDVSRPQMGTRDRRVGLVVAASGINNPSNDLILCAAASLQFMIITFPLETPFQTESLPARGAACDRPSCKSMQMPDRLQGETPCTTSTARQPS